MGGRGHERGQVTVGRHLSELQLSEHVGYPNTFSKATPNISSYFRRVSGFALLVVKRHRILTSTGFATKVKATVKVTHCMGTASLPREMETEQWLAVVRILVIITYTVSCRLVESGNVSTAGLTSVAQR